MAETTALVTTGSATQASGLFLLLAAERTTTTARLSDLQRETSYRRELLTADLMNHAGRRITLRERRLHELEQLRVSQVQKDAQWRERLQRVEQWDLAVIQLRSQLARAASVLKVFSHVSKLTYRAPRIEARLKRHAHHIEDLTSGLSHRLELWIEIISPHLDQIEDLHRRESQKGEKLCMSRARLQPELDFLAEQNHEERELANTLAFLRRALQREVGRSRRLQGLLSTRAVTLPEPGPAFILFLKAYEEELAHLRERVLVIALSLEAARRTFKRCTDLISQIRCLEEAMPANESSWLRRLLRPTA